MISIQVVPRQRVDAYKLLRDKVTHEATTWSWVNKAKSRLRHTQVLKGYIEVSSADGVLIAQIYPKAPKDLFYLSEKFIGRLIGWFDDQLLAINIQFVPEGKKQEGGYDKNKRTTCPVCKKSIAGPWSFKKHLMNQHDYSAEKAGLTPRSGDKKSRDKTSSKKGKK